MSLPYAEERSPIAPWSLRLATFSVQLAIVGLVLHRFASLATPITLNLLAIAYLGLGAAVIVAIWALSRIWQRGESGAGRAGLALVLGSIVLLVPLALLPKVWAHPEITDVSTDGNRPPIFAALASARLGDGGQVAYEGAAAATLQSMAYPDIQTIRTGRTKTEAFTLVRELVKQRGWKVALEKAPDGKGSDGTIEASERTLVMGFTDDISIRVGGSEDDATIDLRSASRFAGVHDLARNAERVRDVLKELRLMLAASVSADVAAADEEDDASEATAGGKRKKRSEESAAPRKKRVRVLAGSQDGRGKKGKPRRKSSFQEFRRGVGQSRR